MCLYSPAYTVMCVCIDTLMYLDISRKYVTIAYKEVKRYNFWFTVDFFT